MIDGRKVPKRPDGSPASSTDAATWSTFDQAAAAADRFDGIGFVFSADDPFVGIDLDACRDAATGIVAPWAQAIVDDLATYVEVSPSGTGLHLIARGELPSDTGRKAAYAGGKVEAYSHGRYFCTTGNVAGLAVKPIAERTGAITALWNRVFEVKGDAKNFSQTPIDDVRAAILELPDSISGDGGHDKALRAACEILRHGVDGEAGRALLDDYNAAKCDPPWSKAELDHKWKSANEKVLRGREFGIVAERGKATYRVLSSAELEATDFPIEFLIEGVLVAGQPLIIAGPQKSLKTSTMIDAVISLASGSPFLSTFTVNRPCRVMVMSGESGLPTIKETAQRICLAKGLKLGTLDKLFWSDDLPIFGEPIHLTAIEKLLADYRVDVLIIDPLYLALPGVEAGNAQIQGQLLRSIGRICEQHGVCMALAHHTKKLQSRDAYQPLDTNDMAYSAGPQFARQWWLVNRRERYAEGSGEHRLWLSVGGSVGQSSIWGVDIAEGIYCPLVPRVWDVKTFSASEARDGDSARKTSATAEGDAAKVVAALQQLGGPETARAIREKAGLNSRHFKNAIDWLIISGDVRECSITKNNRTYDAFELANPPSEGMAA